MYMIPIGHEFLYILEVGLIPIDIVSRCSGSLTILAPHMSMNHASNDMCNSSSSSSSSSPVRFTALGGVGIIVIDGSGSCMWSQLDFDTRLVLLVLDE